MTKGALQAASTLPFEALKKVSERLKIFCDCDGTLFSTNMGERFNENLFRYLTLLKQRGHEVTIFSAEPNANETLVKFYSQKITGNSMFFAGEHGFAVMPKSAFSGENAYLVIDDDHSTHRVIAEHQWDPNDTIVRQHILQTLQETELPAPHLQTP